MEERGWPIEAQIADVLRALRVHRAGGSRQVATDREICILEELIECGYLEPWARDYFGRMEPEEQPAREEWLFAGRERRLEERGAPAMGRVGRGARSLPHPRSHRGDVARAGG